MLTQKLLRLFLSILIILPFLNACGGGGGGGGKDNSPPSRQSGTISGVVFDAPVKGATVTVYEYQNGATKRVLGSGVSNVKGQYTIKIKGAASTPILITAERGEYYDPFSKETVQVGDTKLRSVSIYEEGNDQDVMVTPLTNIVAGLTAYKIEVDKKSTKTAISESLKALKDLYGFDVNQTTPNDILKSGGAGTDSNGYQYGALLTAFSSMGNECITKAKDTDEEMKEKCSSIYLANLAYRDVVEDGDLNGFSDSERLITFKPLSEETYTSELAHHMLIALSDPINLSMQNASDYVAYANAITNVGTDKKLDIFPIQRERKTLEKSAPEVTRLQEASVLFGQSSVIYLGLKDETGVGNIEDIKISLKTQLDASDESKGWSQPIECSQDQKATCYIATVTEDGSAEFIPGSRSTQLFVYVNTEKLNSGAKDSGAKEGSGRLEISIKDSIGNEDFNGSKLQLVDFKWNNNGPVINITSKDKISNTNKYTLSGYVNEKKESLVGEAPIAVLMNGQPQENLSCEDKNGQCFFEKEYELTEEVTQFILSTQHKDGLTFTTEPFVVTKDTTIPTIKSVSFPGGVMKYIDTNGERTVIKKSYDQYTYQQGSVDDSTKLLKITQLSPDIGEDFNSGNLDAAFIPYIKLAIEDTGGVEGVKIQVRYSVKREGSDKYIVIKKFDSKPEIPKNLKKVLTDNTADIYLPYITATLGHEFQNQLETTSHKLEVRAIDGGDNVQKGPDGAEVTKTVYFRTTFEKPEIKAKASFETKKMLVKGLGGQKEFDQTLGSTSVKSDEGYSLSIDFKGNKVIQLGFIDKNNKSLSSVGAYISTDNVSYSEANRYYITELSSYHIGLFDYYWDNETNKTTERAAEILQDITKALTDWFGFDPIKTPFKGSTNNINTPLDLTEKHTLLLEAFKKITVDNDTPEGAVYKQLQTGELNEIFRHTLAQNYQIELNKVDGITESEALGLANEIALGEPKINGASLFKSTPTNLDQLAPWAIVSIDNISDENTGSRYGDEINDNDIKSHDKNFIRGRVGGSLWLRDISGVISNDAQQDFGVYGVQSDKSRTPLEIGKNKDIEITRVSDKKPLSLVEYSFDVNTENLPENTDKIEIENLSKDSVGNVNKYDSQQSCSQVGDITCPLSLVVDNKGPIVSSSFFVGKDLVEIKDGDKVYFNASSPDEKLVKVRFTLADKVGVSKEDRAIRFSRPNNDSISIKYTEPFIQNTEDYFELALCTNVDECKDKNTVYPIIENDPDGTDGNGEWNAKVITTDRLGNESFTTFQLALDSKKPIILPKIESNDVEVWLGENQQWQPEINWGLAPAQEVNFAIKNDSNIWDQIEQCTGSDSKPCLTGTQPKTKIKMGTNSKQEYKLRITAIKATVPSNKISREITIKLDSKKPVINLDTPQFTSQGLATLGQKVVVGKEFAVNFASLEDDSKIASVSLFNGETLITQITEVNASGKFKLIVNEADSNKIGNDVAQSVETQLTVKAADEHGNSSSVDLKELLIDREGPSFSIEGYDENNLYQGGYEMTLAVKDINSEGEIASDGVDPATLKYRLGQGNENKIVNDKIVLPEGEGDHALSIMASDIRGNQGQADYVVKVSNAEPKINNAVFYYEGQPDQTFDGIITQSKTVFAKFTVDNVVNNVSAKLQGSDADLKVVLEQNSYLIELKPEVFPYDGNYVINIIAESSIIPKDPGSPLETSKPVSVQVMRESSGLVMTEPTNFIDHIAGPTLVAKFKPQGGIGAKKIQCWIRVEADNIPEGTVPLDNNAPYSESLLEANQSEYSCELNNSSNIAPNSKPILIVKLVNEFDAETVTHYPFNMVDVDAPSYPEARLVLPYDAVYRDLENSQKMLIFTLNFHESLSGLASQPKLQHTRAGKLISPVSNCTYEAAKWSCTYITEYAEVFKTIDPEQNFKVLDLVDNAGNRANEVPLIIERPTKNVGLEVQSPLSDSASNSSGFFVKLKFNLQEIEKISVKFGSEEKSIQDFDSFQRCGDASLCTQAYFDIPDDLKNTRFNIEIEANNLWGHTSDVKNIEYLHDLNPPLVDSQVVIETSPSNADQVRFRFAVSDAESGVQKVTYQVLDKTIEKVSTPSEPNAFSYLDLEKSTLSGLETLRFKVTVFDKAGNKTPKDINVDLSASKLTLSFVEFVTQTDSGLLLLKNKDQSFKVEQSTGVEVKDFSLVFIQEQQEKMTFTGSPEDIERMINFTELQQGRYQLKLIAKDVIGREIKTFEFLNTDNTEINTIVDFESPKIDVLGTEVTDEAVDEKYKVTVKADISDVMLHSVEVWAVDKKNDSKVKLGQEESSIPPSYVFNQFLEPGDYTIKIIAQDTAGNPPTTTYSDLSVIASLPPEVTIGSSRLGALSGGEKVMITFTFDQPVVDFSLGNISLSSEQGSDQLGTFSDWRAIGDNDDKWEVSYTAPIEVDKSIQLTVDNSFQSKKNIKGKGAKFELEIQGALPTVKSVNFAEQLAPGNSLDIAVEFSTEVEPDFSVKLRDAEVSMEQDGSNKKVWEGKIEVPDTSEQSLPIKIEGYQDSLGNTGKVVERTLTVLPSLTVKVIDPEWVNVERAKSLELSGTTERFEDDDLLLLSVGDQKVQVKVKDNEWNKTIDASMLPDGEVTFTVSGRNSVGATAQAQGSFKLDKALPVLNPETDLNYQLTGDKLTVTASFSEPVTMPTVSVSNGLQLTWNTDGDPLKKEWVSEPLSLASHNNVESLSFTFSGFKDKTGNAGGEVTSTYTLTPKLTLDAINGGNNVGITPDAKLALSGTYQFLEHITLVVTDSSNAKVEKRLDLDNSGTWTDELDLSSIAAGEVKVTVKGNGVPPAKNSFIYDNQAPTLDATDDVSYQLEDDALTVTASFSEPVTMPTVSVSNGLQLTWKTDGDPLKKEWVSEPLSLASVDKNVESLSFTFTGFKDKAGYAGAEVISTYTLAPELPLDAINGGKNVGITPAAKL
ncbi:hypothetical protein, partial [Vibrio caribbeanicus]|uniref:hypothetical protein n=1 Tax=Vibrio caribbeanicus TaxID=701175 RepID=UPI0030DD37AC